jgi:hypothetical protein
MVMTHNRGFPFLLIAVAMLATIAPGYAQPRPSDAEIATLLRAGGHVIVIRHGATHPDQADTDPLNTTMAGAALPSRGNQRTCHRFLITTGLEVIRDLRRP